MRAKIDSMDNYSIEGDQADSTRMRMNSITNSSCTDEIMQIIQTVVDQNSPYTEAYKYMHAVEQSEELCASAENRSPREVRLHFKRGPDQRRYNEPTHEVAAVFIGAPPVNRDIVIYPRDRPPQRISYMSCNLDPMYYPLLLLYFLMINYIQELQD